MSLLMAAAEGGMSDTQYWFLVFYIFVLAVAVGVILIAKVPPLLQTPLMSGSNAISGITLVGAILAAIYGGLLDLKGVLAFVGVTLATINVVGGYTVTDRMLQMFRKKK